VIRLWVSRKSSIPIREQLAAQLLFGILSRKIAPGDRLPSVRDLARRLKVHANTVSGAYRDLAARGWVEQRRGSGVYVRDGIVPEPFPDVEAFARAWMDDGLARGFTHDAIEAAVIKIGRESGSQPAPQRFLVVHADRGLGEILATEIAAAVPCPVSSAGLEDAARGLGPETCLLVTAAGAAQAVKQLQPALYRVVRLKSMEDAIAGKRAPASGLLVAVVSSSPSILDWTAKLLSSLGLPGMDILQRNPDQPDWQSGLAACDIVAADVVAALKLPKKIKPTVFRIVAEDFLAEARALVTPQKV
jgi:DNA-binding transcriptional regulator YhcF (GntR family)